MTSYALQFRKGTTAEHSGFIGLIGEITYDSDLKTIRVHDGVTPGGHLVGGSLSNNPVTATTGTFSGLIANTVDLDGGHIDGTEIGATTSAAGTFTVLTSNIVDLNGGNVDGTIVGATSSAAGTFSFLTSDSIDLNGGNVDGTIIGATVSAAGTFSTMTTSGADIDGGTIDGTLIGSSVSSSAIFTSMTTDIVDINGGTIDGTSIGNSVPDTAIVTSFKSTGITDTTTTATQLILTDTSATFANDVVVGGNLTVAGTTTIVNTETIELADNIIELNSNAVGLPIENAGIEVNRGTEPAVSFYWDETGDTWTVNGEKLTVGEFEISQDAYVHDTVRVGRGPNDDISNTVLGTLVFDSNISGGQNVAVGAYAMFNNTFGDNNTAVGREALRNNITGHKNTAIGGGAGNWITSADENTMIGYEAQPVNLNSPHQLTIVAGPVKWASGFGHPEGMVEGLVGSIYTDQDGGIGSTFYTKEHGTGPTGGSTGWIVHPLMNNIPDNGVFDVLVAAMADINDGEIDGTAIGEDEPAIGIFTELTANNSFTLNGSTPLLSVDEDLTITSAIHDTLTTALAVKTYVDDVDLGFQADTGGALSINLATESMTFTGGYGINTIGATNDVTVVIDLTETADLTTAQTLENKTLISPIINAPDIDGGTMDGTIIGATTSAAGTFSTMTSDLVDINGGDIDSVTIDGSVIGATTSAAGTFSSLTSDSVDVNGGNVDGTIIGATVSAAGTFSTMTSDLVDINGGDIDSVTIDGSVIGATTSAAGTFSTMTSDLVDINGGDIDDVTIDSSVIGATVSAAATFSTMTSDSVDVNGGNVDGTIIGATTSAAGTFSTLATNSVDINGGDIDSVTIDDSVIGATTSAAGTFSTLATNSVDINGGDIDSVTIDDSVIGATTPAAATFSTMTTAAATITGGGISGTDVDMTGEILLLDNDQISGDKVHGGVISDFASIGIDDNSTTLQITVEDTATTFANNVVVTGDLTVSGTTTTVNTETIELADNTILINSNATGAAIEDAGLEVERGIDTNVSFLWDETNDKWTVGSETFVAGSLETTGDIWVHDIVRVGRGEGDITTNTVVGALTLNSNTTGTNNTASGYQSLFSNTTGSNNVASGYQALNSNTTGDNNVSVGNSAGHSITTGSFNTSIGNTAGDTITTGSSNTSIGTNAQPTTATSVGQFTLGDTNVVNLRCNDTTISALSDSRDKTDVVDSPFGLDFMNTLRPVQYTWKTRDGNIKDGKTRVGFLAQDLLETGNNDITDLVLDENPDRLEAKYGNLIPIMAKAIQELSAEVDRLKSKLGE